MSLLSLNSTPAERFVGCSFAENFESPSHVLRNGGTITGSPTFDAKGINLNGTSDYVTYQLQGNEFNSDEISIVIEFYPNFSADDNVRRVLIDASDSATGNDEYFVSKEAPNELRVDLGNVTVLSAALGDYQAYWKQGERNVLVISGTSGNNRAWLNGTSIKTSSTVWAPSSIDTMYVGVLDTLIPDYFDGKITSVKVFQSLLDAQDAAAYYNNTMYNYMNDAVLHLPMTAEYHDPTNTRALDVSGNGNHATFGDGATSTTFPTKLSKRGYSFDGGDYFELSSTGLKFESSSEDFTIAAFALSSSDTIEFICDVRDANDDGWRLVKANDAVWVSLDTTDVKSDADFSNGSLRTIICPVNRSGFSQIYLNGNTSGLPVDTSGITMNISTSTLRIGVSSYSLASGFYNGKIYQLLIWNKALSSIQIADLHLRMLQELNNV